MMKDILITGGAGYAGSLLTGLLLNDGYNVIVADSLKFGGDGLSNLRHYPNFKFIKGDISSLGLLKAVFKDHDIDAIVHLAAIVGDPACAKHPDLAKRVNWDASIQLLEYAIKNNVCKFVFASTCSNYGKMADADKYVDERSPLAPVSLYAELKVRFENVILNEFKKANFCPTALRFATIYGVSPRMRFDLTVNEFTKELALGRELEVFGEEFWRPYCHVHDFARAVSLVLNSDSQKVAYEVFNVGATEENYQKRMIIEEIKKFIPEAKVRYIKKDEDPRDYRVSFEKIKRELGFTVSRRLSDGIKEVKRLIDSKLLLNPDDSKYRNA